MNRWAGSKSTESSRQRCCGPPCFSLRVQNSVFSWLHWWDTPRLGCLVPLGVLCSKWEPVHPTCHKAPCGLQWLTLLSNCIEKKSSSLFPGGKGMGIGDSWKRVPGKDRGGVLEGRGKENEKDLGWVSSPCLCAWVEKRSSCCCSLGCLGSDVWQLCYVLVAFWPSSPCQYLPVVYAQAS
jgi:hypothetical protein